MHTSFELFGTEGLDKSGWAGLVNPFLYKIEKYNKDKPDEEKILITQIKEKWATLRLYVTAATNEIWDDIELRESASAHICEICGSPFHVGKTQYGWIRTVCKRCVEKESILCEWKEEYHSVRMSKTIKIALKIDSFFNAIFKLYDEIDYKIYRFLGHIKYILSPKKYKNTIFKTW